MKLRPSVETRQKVWKKVNLWIVFFAVVIAVVGLGYGISQQREVHTLLQRSIYTSNLHHAETAKQNKALLTKDTEIKAQNAEIITLLNQHSLNFAQEVQEFVYVNQTLACVANHTPCPPPPAFLGGK